MQATKVHAGRPERPQSCWVILMSDTRLNGRAGESELLGVGGVPLLPNFAHPRGEPCAKALAKGAGAAAIGTLTDATRTEVDGCGR